MDKILINLLRQFNPETAHNISLKLLKYAPVLPSVYKHKSLELKVADLNFINPIGMAAGFDKNAEVFNSLAKIGFGFTEIGRAHV